jgi:streptogramin lyase
VVGGTRRPEVGGELRTGQQQVDDTLARVLSAQRGGGLVRRRLGERPFHERPGTRLTRGPDVGREGRLHHAETPDPGRRGPIPYEIRVSPKGQLWLSELRGNRLLSVDPATRKVESYDMPVSLSGPRRFDIDRNGILWIPAYANNALVRLDPATREFRSFTLPMRDALPYVARINHTTGRVWLGTGAADAVLEFDPAAGTFRAFSLPTRGALVRHLAVNERTGEVWVAYGESPGKASSRIARIRPTR